MINKRLFIVTFIFFVSFFITTNLFMFIKKRQTHHRTVNCETQLAIIAVALHQYHAEFGCFPPAYLADRHGKPIHSWRVLLLATAGYPAKAIYDAYDFNEPWDGPHNRMLENNSINIYKCPNYTNTNKTDTNYMAIIGPGTVFSEESPLDHRTKVGDRQRRIVISEVSIPNVHWMEPFDLEVSKMSFKINKISEYSMSSNHEEGPAVLFDDGNTSRISTSTSEGEIKKKIVRSKND